jgi:hypothetical protein
MKCAVKVDLSVVGRTFSFFAAIGTVLFSLSSARASEPMV